MGIDVVGCVWWWYDRDQDRPSPWSGTGPTLSVWCVMTSSVSDQSACWGNCGVEVLLTVLSERAWPTWQAVLLLTPSHYWLLLVAAWQLVHHYTPPVCGIFADCEITFPLEMSSTWNNIYSYKSEISTLQPVSCGVLGGYTIFCALTRTTDNRQIYWVQTFRVSDTRLNTLYTEWIISEFVSHWSRSWLPRKTRVWNFDLHFSLSTAN